jgi:hypothetical protein
MESGAECGCAIRERSDPRSLKAIDSRVLGCLPLPSHSSQSSRTSNNVQIECVDRAQFQISMAQTMRSPVRVGLLGAAFGAARGQEGPSLSLTRTGDEADAGVQFQIQCQLQSLRITQRRSSNRRNMWGEECQKNRFYCRVGERHAGLRPNQPGSLMLRVLLLCDLCRVRVARVCAESLG